MGTRKHPNVTWVDRSSAPQGSLIALSEVSPVVGATFPGTPREGDIWVDTVLNQFKLYFDGMWMAGGSVNGNGGTLTIVAGQALSPVLDTGGLVLGGVQVPSGWTAAALTFQASPDGINYADLYDDAGNEVTAQAAASRAVAIDAIALVLSSWRYLKLRSGTAASPVPQAANAVLRYALKGG